MLLAALLLNTPWLAALLLEVFKFPLLPFAVLPLTLVFKVAVVGLLTTAGVLLLALLLLLIVWALLLLTVLAVEDDMGKDEDEDEVAGFATVEAVVDEFVVTGAVVIIGLVTVLTAELLTLLALEAADEDEFKDEEVVPLFKLLPNDAFDFKFDNKLVIADVNEEEEVLLDDDKFKVGAVEAAGAFTVDEFDEEAGVFIEVVGAFTVFVFEADEFLTGEVVEVEDVVGFTVVEVVEGIGVLVTEFDDIFGTEVLVFLFKKVESFDKVFQVVDDEGIFVFVLVTDVLDVLFKLVVVVAGFDELFPTVETVLVFEAVAELALVFKVGTFWFVTVVFIWLDLKFWTLFGWNDICFWAPWLALVILIVDFCAFWALIEFNILFMLLLNWLELGWAFVKLDDWTWDFNLLGEIVENFLLFNDIGAIILEFNERLELVFVLSAIICLFE